jgi:hypothetical protein
MGTTATLLSRLDGVRESAPGRWMSRCPSHEDRSPSLSIRELEDGRVLLHCFAGCGAADVLVSVGLGLSDLFPAPLTMNGNKPTRPNHFHAAREALRVLHFETLVVAIGAENLAQGVTLSDEDRERLALAACRIRQAAGVCA